MSNQILLDVFKKQTWMLKVIVEVFWSMVVWGIYSIVSILSAVDDVIVSPCLEKQQVAPTTALHIAVRQPLKVQPKQLICCVIQLMAGTAARVRRNTYIIQLRECSVKRKRAVKGNPILSGEIWVDAPSCLSSTVLSIHVLVRWLQHTSNQLKVILEIK